MANNFRSIPERSLRKVPLLKKLFSTNKSVSHDSIFIDPAFKNEIIAHYILNLSEGHFVSVILAVEGPPGEGKTFQLQETIKGLGAPYVTLSASQLSGPHEGDALVPLENAYQQLSDACGPNNIGCLIIDDFDLSPAGRHVKTEYSVNSQLITSFLMSIADNPSVCCSQTVRRSAIFLTGNNLSSLYPALTRKGRCRTFEWRPSAHQKINMLIGLLRSIGVEEAQSIAEKIIPEFPNLPIATFRASVEEYCFEVVKARFVDQYSYEAEPVQKFLYNALASLKYEEFSTAVRQIADSQLKNHIVY